MFHNYCFFLGGIITDHCPRLKTLALSQCSAVTDESLAPIADMEELEELTLKRMCEDLLMACSVSNAICGLLAFSFSNSNM